MPQKAPDRSYRRAVQLVLQDPFASLNPAHTVRYILSRPLQIHGLAGDDLEETRPRAAAPGGPGAGRAVHRQVPARALRWSAAAGLDRPGLAVQPRVLLADEPVSMLDVSIRLGVLNLLADLRDQERIAILYVTHDIASARYLADTIMVMYAGQVVEVGPADTDRPTRPRIPTPSCCSRRARSGDRREAWLGGVRAPPSLVRPPRRMPVPSAVPARHGHLRTEQPPSFDVPGRPTARRAGCTHRAVGPSDVGGPRPLPAGNLPAGGERRDFARGGVGGTPRHDTAPKRLRRQVMPGMRVPRLSVCPLSLGSGRS